MDMKSILLAGVFAMAASPASIHDFSMKALDGKELPLSSFKGKVVLIVNTASQ